MRTRSGIAMLRSGGLLSRRHGGSDNGGLSSCQNLGFYSLFAAVPSSSSTKKVFFPYDRSFMGRGISLYPSSSPCSLGGCRRQNPQNNLLFFGSEPTKYQLSCCRNFSVDERELSPPDAQNASRVSRIDRNDSQRALFEYLHHTRSLPFSDAEHMSKNSPVFLQKLLEKVEDEQDVGRSLTRFFNFHPINEFEPFFESSGLKAAEFYPLLPRNLMFLSDDAELLENYRVLCSYGVPRGKVGKIYKEGTEIFRYVKGLLPSKFQAYEELGLSRPAIIKLVTCCPTLLIGDVDQDLLRVLERFKNLGIDLDLLRACLSDRCTYNWKRVLLMLDFLDAVRCTKEEILGLLSENSRFIFEDSGKKIFLLFAMLLKLGIKVDKVRDMFVRYPRMLVGCFTRHLWQAVQFLSEIGMDAQEIARLTYSHPHVFGAGNCKKADFVLRNLNMEAQRLCEIIKDDPFQFSSLAGEKKMKKTMVAALPKLEGYYLREKTEFLLKLGFVENSDEMAKALRLFRGRGDELQERFDCLLNIGLDCHTASQMIRQVPQILNQSKMVIQTKVEYLQNHLEYPLEEIVAFPSCLCYSLEKMQLRFAMKAWLKENVILRETTLRRHTNTAVSLSTVLACSEARFAKYFVDIHPEGRQEWERLKKELLPSS